MWPWPVLDRLREIAFGSLRLPPVASVGKFGGGFFLAPWLGGQNRGNA